MFLASLATGSLKTREIHVEMLTVKRTVQWSLRLFGHSVLVKVKIVATSSDGGARFEPEDLLLKVSISGLLIVKASPTRTPCDPKTCDLSDISVLCSVSAWLVWEYLGSSE